MALHLLRMGVRVVVKVVGVKVWLVVRKLMGVVVAAPMDISRIKIFKRRKKFECVDVTHNI
jgi:hypothetical protein